MLCDRDECLKNLAVKFLQERAFDVDAEFSSLLETSFMKLDVKFLQASMMEYLENRIKVPSNSKKTTFSLTPPSAEDVSKRKHPIHLCISRYVSSLPDL